MAPMMNRMCVQVNILSSSVQRTEQRSGGKTRGQWRKGGMRSKYSSSTAAAAAAAARVTGLTGEKTADHIRPTQATSLVLLRKAT